MATNFYKSGTSYFEEGTNKKILNLDSLKQYSQAGGKEISAPTAKAGSVAIPTAQDIPKYNVTNQIGGTLYGTMKTPTTADLTMGANTAGATPPEPQAPAIYQNIAQTTLDQMSQGSKDVVSMYEQQRKDAETKIAELTKANEEYKAKQQTDVIQPYNELSSPFRADLEKANNDKFEVDRQIKESITLADDLKTYSQLLNNELTSVKSAGRISGFVNAEKANILSTYTSKIYTAQAALSAYQGNIGLVQTYTDRAINAIVADRTDRIDYLNFINNIYESDMAENRADILTLTKDEKDAINGQIETFKTEINRIQTNKDSIVNLMSNPDTAVAAHKAGVLLTDTPEQVAEKLGKYYAANPPMDEKNKPVKIGVDENGNDIFATYDQTSNSWKPVSTSGDPNSGKIITSASGNSYDMSTYAASETQYQRVQDIMNGIGQFTSPEEIDQYIQSRQPSSPITSAEITAASEKYGVGWEELVGLIQHESILGTSNVAQKNSNFGGITWSQTYQDSHPGVSKGTARPAGEGGNYVKFNSVQDGVNAVAEQLARRKTSGETGGNNSGELITSDGYDISKFTKQFYNTKAGQQTLNNEQQYYTNFQTQQQVKDFVLTQAKEESVAKIIDSGVGGPGDLALVFEFMKALDPTSVVRETEYETAAKSGNIFAGVFSKFNGYLKEEGGFLPDNVKTAFLDIVRVKNEVNKKTYNQLRSQARKTAYEQGLNPDHVAPDLIIDKNEIDDYDIDSWVMDLNIGNSNNKTSNSTESFLNSKGL